MDTPPTCDSDLMTSVEVAAKLRVTPWFITKRCRTGEISATKPGKAWLITQADLDVYLAAHRNSPGDVA